MFLSPSYSLRWLWSPAEDQLPALTPDAHPIDAATFDDANHGAAVLRSGADMPRSRVSKWFPERAKFFSGTVMRFGWCNEEETALVRYDDGDEEVLTVVELGEILVPKSDSSDSDDDSADGGNSDDSVSMVAAAAHTPPPDAASTPKQSSIDRTQRALIFARRRSAFYQETQARYRQQQLTSTESNQRNLEQIVERVDPEP
jgi:hypothetical protein